ncbi:MAG: RHS repeat protein, partial [Ignavibacteriaceae bacterium]|nr:RHS repeat protein [Ignavibacteriaceae bacterium]
MSVPFSLFCSNNLGTSNSSHLQAPLLTSRAINASKTQIGINAANGNTVIRDTEFSIQDDGVTLSVGMLWNSLDKQWRFAAAPKIQVSHFLWNYMPQFLGGQTVILNEADGAEVRYVYDAERKVYLASSSSLEGTSTLTINPDGSYERSYPGNDITEKFDTLGRLRERSLPTGKKIIYGYDANNQVNEIILPSQRKLSLETDENNFNTRHLNLINIAQEQCKLASFKFDDINHPNILTTSIPQPDNTEHETTYSYSSTEQGCALQITSSDNSAASISLDNNGVIKKIEENNRSWKFELDTAENKMIVTDKSDNQYEIGFDQNKHLSSFKLPTDVTPTEYQFTESGLLEKVIDTDKAKHSITYEKATGLIDTETDSLGKTKKFIYETDPTSDQFGLKLAEIKTDNGQTAACHYVYNDQRQCLYEVTAAGRVTKFEYNNNDRLDFKKKSTLKFFESDTYNLQTLNLFWDTLTATDLKQLQITQLGYDQYGRRNEETNHSATDENGIGIIKSDTAHVHQYLDEKGRVTQIDITKVNGDEKQLHSTITKQDNLNRIIELSEGAQEASKNTRKTTKTYHKNKTTIQHAHGLKETLTHDAGGLLTEHVRSTLDESQSRKTDFQRDNNGKIKTVVGDDQKPEHNHYDKSGRLQFKILANGKLSEYQYDARGQIALCKEYNIKIENPNDPTLDIQGLISQNTAALSLYSFYDSEAKLTHEVKVKDVTDEAGLTQKLAYVFQHEYSLGNKVRTTQFSSPFTNINSITPSSIDDFCEKMSFSPNESNRIQQFFYDKDDLLIGEYTLSDSENLLGYLKTFDRDGAGNIYRETVYLNKLAPIADLASLNLNDTPKLETLFIHDNAGRKIASIDADNYLTTYTYYANSKLSKETYYATPLELDRSTLTIENLNNLIFPEVDKSKDKVITHEYDDLNRECKITNSQTNLEITNEYDLQDNIIHQILKDLLTDQSRIIQKEYNEFDELTREATPRITQQMKNADDKEKWIAHKIHPITGLRLSTTDALGNITLYYYDKNRRPVLEVLANGVVKLIEYDLVCNKPTKVTQRYPRLTAEILAQLKQDEENNGFLKQNVISFLPLTHDSDRVTTTRYESEGLEIETTSFNKGTHAFTYNSFSELESEKHQVDKNIFLKIKHTHDLRGNFTQTIKDPDGLKITTSKKHDDALNRVTETSDELNSTLKIEHPLLRTSILTDSTDANIKKTILEDAFYRKTSETDWTNSNATIHKHNDALRTKETISPENRSQTIAKNAFDDIISTTENGHVTDFKHKVDSNIDEIIHPDGSTEENTFTISGLDETHKATNGKLTKYIKNVVGLTTEIIDDLNGEKHTTHITPDTFGEDETTISPGNLSVKNEITESGLVNKTITDPDNLGLLTTHTHNFAGGVKQIKQGDVAYSNLYQEDIGLDVLNRETTRTVAMDNGKTLTLKNQSYDAAGNTISVADGLGNVTRKVYDKRGNLRFIIDAENFVIEKIYDANKKEIAQRSYAIPFTAKQIANLSDKSTPQNISELLDESNNDALRQRIYDKDGLLQFEINFIDKNNDISTARITEWKRNAHGECIQRIHYADYLNSKDHGLNEQVVPTVESIKSILSAGQLANNPNNRTTDFCRNKKSKIIFRRDAEGYITETKRDVSGKVIAKTLYADKYINLDFNVEPELLRAQLSKTSDNRQSYFVYDLFGNLGFQIDGEGFVKEFQYNKENQVTDYFSYYHKLSERLSSDDIQKLFEQMEQEGASRNVIEIINAINAAVGAIKDELKDVHNIKKYDSAKRHTHNVDGEDNEEEFILNALGLKEYHIDKTKNKWGFKFDKAKRLETETSPMIDIAIISQDKNTLQLSKDNNETSVIKKLGYDDASNQTNITSADNIKSEKRSVQVLFNKKRLPIGTVIENVTVDDGTDVLPEESKRPEVKKNITTHIKYDYANRPIVNIDEKNISRFTVYDRSGRERFHIDGDGYVIENQYTDSFTNPTKIIQHSVAINKDVILANINGFSLDTMLTLISELDKKDDRTVTLTYDRRGLKKSAEKDKIITPVINGEKIKAAEASPRTSWDYNAFGNIIKETTLINANNESAATRNFHDNNGNLILTISPKGYVTTQLFGMHVRDTNSNEHILLNRIEFELPLSAEINWDNYNAVLKSIQKHAKDV